jgi:hypothetical protein
VPLQRLVPEQGLLLMVEVVGRPRCCPALTSVYTNYLYLETLTLFKVY